MKKILTIALAAACSFTACDIERLPYDKYSADKITEDKQASLDILLNGCYAQLKGWSDVMHRVGEYAGDNMMIRGSSTDAFYTFISYQHTPSNYRLNTFWNNSYKVISQASDLMKLVEEGETPEVDQRLGEAYYLRGTMYFYLCRAYGRPYYQSPETNLGVPIVNGLPADLNNLVLPDRASVKDTYAQAIADLRKGEALMNENKTAAYATREAAQAMLSRVYMYMSGTYENPNTTYADSSIYYAKKVIESGRYQLLNRENFMKYNTSRPKTVHKRKPSLRLSVYRPSFQDTIITTVSVVCMPTSTEWAGVKCMQVPSIWNCWMRQAAEKMPVLHSSYPSM